MNIKEGQLVKILYLFCVDSGQLISNHEHYNNEPQYKRDFNVRKLATWVRVRFIDLDGTFIGEPEKIERNTWSDADVFIFKLGEPIKFNVDRVCGVEDPLFIQIFFKRKF